jgi:hypothetical protein
MRMVEALLLAECLFSLLLGVCSVRVWESVLDLLWGLLGPTLVSLCLTFLNLAATVSYIDSHYSHCYLLTALGLAVICVAGAGYAWLVACEWGLALGWVLIKWLFR